MSGEQEKKNYNEVAVLSNEQWHVWLSVEELKGMGSWYTEEISDFEDGYVQDYSI